MKLLRSVFCFTALMGTANAVLAAETPFAGTWKLNPAKSWRLGPHGLAGGWNGGAFDENSASLLVINDADGGLVFDEPGFKLKATASFNGKPGTVQGPRVPPGAALLLSRLSSHSFRMTRTQNGKLLDTSTWTVSPDGKTMRCLEMKSIDRTGGTHTPPTTEVFDKQ